MTFNFRSIPIGELCQGIYDGPHATPAPSDSGAIFLGISNFVNGKLNLSPSNIRYISEEDYPKWTKRVTPKAHDIVFSYEATLNLYAIIPDGFRGCLGRRMALMRPDEGVVDYRFLYYYMFSPAWREEVERYKVNGSTVDRIPLVSFPSFRVDLPNMRTQKAIADILFAIDQKIDSNSRVNDNLYAQAKAIFDNHFINIDAIPAGWRKGNLLDIANYLNGLAMQKFRPQGHEIGLPVLKIKELRQGSCDDSSELCSLSIKPEYIIHNGDVVFSWSGSLLVDIWCGGTCGLNQHLFKVTSDVYDKWFYYLWTAHHLARFIAIAADKATTMGHIKREELAKAEVLIPCEEDYTSFNSIMQPIFELIISNRIESRKLAALRDELLPKLMTGEIDVSDVQL